MPQGTDDGVIAPKSIILPQEESNVQLVSGAIWISGAALIYMGYDGTGNEFVVTATENA